MNDFDHVPAYLRDMFCEALEYGASHERWWEWFVTEHADQFLWRQREGGEWSRLDGKGRARWLIHRLWDSSEIVPEPVLNLLGAAPCQTYAQVAQRLDREISEEPPVIGRGQASKEPMVPFHVNLPRALMDGLTLTSRQMGMTKAEVLRQVLAAWLSGQTDRARGDN